MLPGPTQRAIAPFTDDCLRSFTSGSGPSPAEPEIVSSRLWAYFLRNDQELKSACYRPQLLRASDQQSFLYNLAQKLWRCGDSWRLIPSGAMTSGWPTIRKLWRAGLNRNAEGGYFYECRVIPHVRTEGIVITLWPITYRSSAARLQVA